MPNYNVPDKFLTDIQARNSRIFPKVIIHTSDDIGWDLYYSTNKLNFDGIYWKPLLLKIPNIKEKYDVDTKKFVVSKLSLSFSNAVYDGSRMSSILKQVGLINKRVTVKYQSHSADVEDDCLTVFYGEIKRVKHDNKTLSIEVHDLGSGIHRELPQTYLEQLMPNSEGKPTPILYGQVENASTVVQKGGTHYKVHFDTCRGLTGMGNPFETSGKLTETTNWQGFRMGWAGFSNQAAVWGHGPITIYIDGKYGEIV